MSEAHNTMEHHAAVAGVKLLAVWIFAGMAFVFHNASNLAALASLAVSIIIGAHTLWRWRNERVAARAGRPHRTPQDE